MEQGIPRGLIWLPLIGLFVLAMLRVTALAMEGDYVAMLLPIAVFALAVLLVVRRYHLPALAVLSMLPGRGVFLGGFGYWDALAAVVVLSCLARSTLGVREGHPMTGRSTWVLITAYGCIMIGHLVANLLGIGTGSEGGQQAAFVSLMTILAGFYILTGRLPEERLAYVPLLGLLPGLFEAALEIVNYVWPSTIMATYALYSNSLNWETFQVLQSGGQVSRLAGLRALGLCLALLCCVRLVRLRRFVSLEGVLVLLGFATSFFLVLLAGYRSYVMAVLTAVAVATYLRSRTLALVGALAMLMALTGLSLYNSRVEPLPLPVQRSICWFPGNWDYTTAYMAREGWTWRTGVWARFMHSVFPQHPWFGQGVRYFAQEARGRTLNGEQLFAVSQLTHSGFLSALDYVGILGTSAFVAVTLRAFYNCLVLVRRWRRRLEPWIVWVMLYFLSQQVWYWLTGFFLNSYVTLTVPMLLLELGRYRMEQGPSRPAPDQSVAPAIRPLR